ncbi:MAG TPA: adenylosuccinate lyase family protein [Stellaceae bacterium]|jgi:3-carboxy-cis,cis-muconate cycloisomerase|nr:adenylosuccinate lyase family protein [Stellaceae bacterium]
MSIGVLQSTLFGDMFGTAAMRAAFGELAFLARCAEVEGALATAQARAGIVPAEAAAAIATAAKAVAAHPESLDLDRLKLETQNVGYPILPLVRQLADRAGEAGRYLHWGATTQDIMDTATVLQIRDGLALIERDLSAVRQHLAGLARRYRDTPMAGRTHLQHALPITFGYKAAVWLAGFDRHAARLAELKPRVLTAQFGGAAGTLASLGPGEASLASRRELARELGLGDPPITWHVARDAIVETVQFLALLGGSLGKIAFDVILMAATEFAEAAEPFVAGRGSSSTMPQKRNPISCELILAASKALRQQAGLVLDAMVSDFERATGPWHVEWIAVPEAFGYAAGALHQGSFMLGGLIVDPRRMARNLDMTHGLIVAEAVMMGLAPHTGRNAAHDLVYDACRAAIESDRPLYDVLLETPEVARPLGPEALRALTDPANYLGAAQAMVDRVLDGRGTN